ncbi:glycoside hydrolase family 18 protein [Moniliophthora roreri]|uniref:Putative endochitinase n=1 Tax=Moniliophthora roreri TaxID=221103 RepID=A0A0W0FPP5_MONRR|nr:glycoside hydrolase family 18 protein [Moniliophthora roreri]
MSWQYLLAISTLVSWAYGANVATAWFASWHANRGFPLSSVSWSKYTQLTYAFAETTPDVNTLSLAVNGDASGAELLHDFVEAAHANGVKAAVSIGGWTGSRWWSTAVGSAENRTTFVKTLTDFAVEYDLDGLDFDWEYPGNQGIGCNTIVPEDTQNFLSFIQELREDTIGSKLILSAATATRPFIDASGASIADTSAFAKVLDFIAIMNYDIWGPWSATVGPNAPLDDSCAPSDAQVGSAASAVKAWTASGFPAEQIVLGVASYGHSFRVRQSDAFEDGSTDTLRAYPPFDAADRPSGDAWDDPAGVDVCGVQQLPGGNFNFWGLIDGGFLDSSGNPTPGTPFRFDSCSQTPYVYNTSTEIMVSFDNADSFTAKGNFIANMGLAGFAMWEAGGDYDDILLDAIRASTF